MDPLVLTSILSLGGLGLIFGAVLAFAARRFGVRVDPRVEEITEILPGSNCGACGYPGCAGLAEALVAGRAPTNACSPGGNSVAQRVAQILGVEAEEVTPMVAIVQCQGGKQEAWEKYTYEGPEDCNAAVLLGGGPKACKYGCLGLGSCARACPFDAIAMDDNGLPVVFEEKCTGCGICVGVCPKGILKLIPRTQKVYLACINPERGKAVREVCTVGCTGCTLCANPKITPSGKVVMEGFLPVIPVDWEDYETAVAKCPANSFVVRDVKVEVKSASY